MKIKNRNKTRTQVSVVKKKSKSELSKRLSEQIESWRRTVRLARKPTKDEFVMVAKITGLGIVIIGLIAYILKIIIHFLGGSL